MPKGFTYCGSGWFEGEPLNFEEFLIKLVRYPIYEHRSFGTTSHEHASAVLTTRAAEHAVSSLQSSQMLGGKRKTQKPEKRVRARREAIHGNPGKRSYYTPSTSLNLRRSSVRSEPAGRAVYPISVPTTETGYESSEPGGGLGELEQVGVEGRREPRPQIGPLLVQQGRRGGNGEPVEA